MVIEPRKLTERQFVCRFRGVAMSIWLERPRGIAASSESSLGARSSHSGERGRSGRAMASAVSFRRSRPQERRHSGGAGCRMSRNVAKKRFFAQDLRSFASRVIFGAARDRRPLGRQWAGSRKGEPSTATPRAAWSGVQTLFQLVGRRRSLGAAAMAARNGRDFLRGGAHSPYRKVSFMCLSLVSKATEA